MRTIYLDECGYTGEDLLNRDQPVFVICTHSLSEAECQDLRQRHFATVSARELKHSDLSKRPAQQKMMLAALEEIAGKGNQIKVGVSHKRYALAMKIIDLLVETSMHALGRNLYKGGGEIAMTNVMYHCMSLDETYLDQILLGFQNMVRQRTPEALDEFGRLIAQPHPLPMIEEWRRVIGFSLKHIGSMFLTDVPSGALDLSFSTAFHLIGMWRTDLEDEGMRLVHDRSTNMSKKKDFWDALVSPDARESRVGFESRTKNFPLAVGETDFESSENSCALQFADVMAGAVAHLMVAQLRGVDGEYERGLARVLGGDPFGGYLLWPSLAITPETLGTQGEAGEDPLDYIAERYGELLGRDRGPERGGGA